MKFRPQISGRITRRVNSMRPTTGFLSGMGLSLIFGLSLLGAATFDLFAINKHSPQDPLPFTIRIPGIGLFKDTINGGAAFHYLRIQYPRGEKLKTDDLRLVQAYEDLRRPPSTPLLLGLGLTFFLLVFFYSTHLRILSSRTALMRSQIVLLSSLYILCLASKAYLLLTPWSGMWIPMGMLIIPVAIHLGPRPAGATAIAGAMILSLMTPIDLALMIVLVAQGLAAGFMASRQKPRASFSSTAVISGLAAGLAYGASSLLLQQFVPGLDLLKQHFPQSTAWLKSDLAGAVGGGMLSGMLSFVTTPILGYFLGILSPSKLISLANFENPLLKQIATRAPGTWAHSLTMANMAEMVANAIGANALLVRVGAYYHDLGKSLQPDYFIENQKGPNPHDRLDPEVSADAIFAHVVEGVKLARKHHLPEPIIEFIWTHHGNGLLEYFWYKNVKLGNPKSLGIEDFHYPGYPPPNAETAILCLCDAIEAASRTITDPTTEKIKQLVRQIVFTKLEHHLLNDSGLTLFDLQRIIESLIDTLQSSYHIRVKYPWQTDENQKNAALKVNQPPDNVSGSPPLSTSVTRAFEEAQTILMDDTNQLHQQVSTKTLSSVNKDEIDTAPIPKNHAETSNSTMRDRQRVHTQPIGIKIQPNSSASDD